MPDPHQAILIADSGCDQCVVTRHWCILRRTERSVVMSGAFSGRNQALEFPVVTAACKITTEDNKQYIAVVHEALYDDTPSPSTAM